MQLSVNFEYLLPAANLSKLPIVDGDHVRGLTAAIFNKSCYRIRERERERERERKRELTHEEIPLGKGMRF
jgi:hypothetical protein